MINAASLGAALDAVPAARPALHYEGRAWSHGALRTEIAAAAALLAVHGVGHGDRIGYLGQNHPSQLVLLFAAARLGALLLPLNWRLAVPELRFVLADAAPRLLFAAPDMPYTEVAPAGCAVLDATAPFPPALPPPASGTADDPVLLVYTSGTTGQPKGAVLDQRAMLANAANAQAAFALTPDDRVLTLLPLFHVGGLNIQTVPALLAGAEVLLLPRFDPAGFFALCGAARPSLTLLVPAVMQALVAHPGWAGADLAALRAIGAGSSEVPLPLIEAFHRRGIPVQQVYGATETGPIALVQTAEEALAAPGSIGRLPRFGEARVVDAGGRPVPTGMQGEIEIRGPQVARGYWGAPPFAAESWFATGDIGRMDAAGRFWFTDRLKHLIISGGENVYPAEVERVLREAPGVAEGAVCGRPDARWGEVPVAVVVPGEGFDPARVLRHFEGRLARFKHPREVVAVEALPRTALGKVRLDALREIARRG